MNNELNELYAKLFDFMAGMDMWREVNDRLLELGREDDDSLEAWAEFDAILTKIDGIRRSQSESAND